MNGETTRRAHAVGRWIIRGLAAAFVCGALLLVPLGGSSTSSEIHLQPYLPRSPHQAYGFLLAHWGLDRSPARDWVLASELAVAAPEARDLPFDSAGRFDPGRPAALGYRFSARGGQRVLIEVTAEAAAAAAPAGGAELGDAGVFVDLFMTGGGRARHVRSAPPLRRAGLEARHRIELAVLEPAEYVLRVQPTLGHDGRYELSIRGAPLLSFPVEGFGTKAIQSGFGAERDGGARAHRGVDIFAPRGTPALAALDAWVSRVETTPRGGNVVWLQPLFGNMRLYYAHLDTQLVRPGDLVLAGDPVGTVGNTGNARTTPPHLHFGVYQRQRGRRGGARDPYPFLD